MRLKKVGDDGMPFNFKDYGVVNNEISNKIMRESYAFIIDLVFALSPAGYAGAIKLNFECILIYDFEEAATEITMHGEATPHYFIAQLFVNDNGHHRLF